MNRAVRGAVEQGIVGAEHIRVARRAVMPDGRSVEAGGRVEGLIAGAIIGGTMAASIVLTWGMVARTSWDASFFWITWRLVAVTLSGALAGALIGVMVGSATAAPTRARLTGDYLVRVDTKDEVAAARIREALARSGGELVAVG